MTHRDHDLFGLEREAKIKSSGVRDVFTPHRPVNSLDLFFGREREVKAVIEQINTPGQHSLLYGERGVGKSSLAAIASELLLSKLIKGQLHYIRCDSGSSFTSLLRKPLAEVGVDISVSQTGTTTTSGGKAKLKLPIAEAGMGVDTEHSEIREGPSGQVSPSFAAEALTQSPGLLVIDEADVLHDTEDRLLLSEFIKQLSDRNAQF